MKLIMFSKMLKDSSITDLIDWAGEMDLDGYDLCVRPDYAVNPDNVGRALPEAVRQFRDAGLVVPMITANFDVLWANHPVVPSLLSAMDAADVRLLKLGYYRYMPEKQDYWREVEAVRQGFSDWQELARKHKVKICYHTHSNRCMGLNAAALAHLVRGFDPACIGAFLDPGHMVAEGEEFAVGLGMVEEYLSIVSVKDMLVYRGEKNGHGTRKHRVVPAGGGMVDWTDVFQSLGRVGYDGPVTVHCEFEVPEGETFAATVKREVAFFRNFVPRT